MKTLLQTYGQTLLIIVLVVLLVKTCQDKKSLKNLHSNTVEAYTDKIKTFKNKLGEVVAQKKSFVGEIKELKEIIKHKDAQFKEALRKFKKPSTAVQVITEVHTDTIRIPYEIPVETPFKRLFNKVDKYYSISGISTHTGVVINGIVIRNKQTIVVGKKRVGFLKYEYVADVTNSNPFIEVTEITSFDFQPRKKRFGLGVFAGYDIRLQPTVGLGVSYDIWSF